jgi:hypothetical protein
MTGVDGDWVPLRTLERLVHMSREDVKAFLNQLCAAKLATARQGTHDEEYRLSYRVGGHDAG